MRFARRTRTGMTRRRCRRENRRCGGFQSTFHRITSLYTRRRIMPMYGRIRTAITSHRRRQGAARRRVAILRGEIEGRYISILRVRQLASLWRGSIRSLEYSLSIRPVCHDIDRVRRKTRSDGTQSPDRAAFPFSQRFGRQTSNGKLSRCPRLGLHFVSPHIPTPTELQLPSHHLA